MPEENDNSSTASGEASVVSSSGNRPGSQPPPTASKKKRNLPGMPDPDAEVIALSPNSLLATNRFVCEICNKGFQRDQNLQLHRRGHNLPWKLRQKSSKEVKKKVYVCPEPSCVHHDPSRALGDLTGIKKHFCRKHGEKKWKCEKCSKKYAVQSDWKAHSKVCGTKEYKCDCGALFSRRDSFITHRAFCDALAQESAKGQAHVQGQGQVPANPCPEPDLKAPKPASPTGSAAAATMPSPVAVPSTMLTDQASGLQEVPVPVPPQPPPPVTEEEPVATTNLVGSCSSSTSSTSNGKASGSIPAGLFASSIAPANLHSPLSAPIPPFTDLLRAVSRPEHPSDLGPSSTFQPISLALSTNHTSSSIFGPSGQDQGHLPPPSQPSLSATALLQKAAQMGATTTNASLLRGLGIISSPSSSVRHQDGLHWNPGNIDSENSTVPLAGLGLVAPGDGELMMGTPSVFGPKHTTLDFLGLGMAADGKPNSSLGVSALITSIGGGDIDMTSAASGSTPFIGGAEFSGKDMSRNS
ncbi:hypothetical protein MLD38_004652 [Melastoma candidum]|uniref:Uncharacterized protein n=1 Tax=Melastoma candidum TaxID=119954 RepID=A0ACB9S5V4_9MYRT|nr:hypothetical protein MLD38_004652 [Melastoma candidum]